MKRNFLSLTAAASLLIGLGVTTLGTAEAVPSKVKPGPPNSISDQYVVVLKKSSAEVKSHTFDGKGAKTIQKYSSALNGLAVKATPDQLAKITADPDVDYVIPDGVVSASQDAQINTEGSEYIPNPPNSYWGLDRIDEHRFPLDNKYRYPFVGSSVNAYVIDTGIQRSHPQFGTRASIGTDTVGDGRNGDDCNGHGTHVAGTIGGSTYGVAKGVKLVAVRVLDCDGHGYFSGVLAGVDWVTGHAVKPAVANMSLGGSYYGPLNAAVTNSIKRGVQYAVAAGNLNDNACNESPGSAPDAVTVGATGNYSSPSSPRSDVRSSYSNFGSCLDIFAPGTYIKSAWLGGGSATISGTSMASPHVAGVLALLLARTPNLTPGQLRTKLFDSSTKNSVGNPGDGSPNSLLFLQQ
jgi:subtilisin family serine protease